MADEAGIITKQLGVWTIHYRPKHLFTRRNLAKARTHASRAVTYGAKAALGLSGLNLVWLQSKPPSSDEKTSSTASSDADVNTSSASTSSVSYVLRFVKEIHSLGPRSFCIDLLCGVWSVVDETLALYASSQLLQATSRCLDRDGCMPARIAYALVFRVILVLFSECVVNTM